ncbi:MAG: hypothetical protein MAGBODY4_00206 [Candidatus Marinimicrobia bacterium]|nr:hypothetical protein [Candidatus Neomarinimicrobiota bacterium]
MQGVCKQEIKRKIVNNHQIFLPVETCQVVLETLSAPGWYNSNLIYELLRLNFLQGNHHSYRYKSITCMDNLN